MNDEEIREAIEKGKLPVSSGDKALLTVGAVCTLFLLALSFKDLNIEVILIFSKIPLIVSIMHIQELSSIHF
jgi:hypothetical protein